MHGGSIRYTDNLEGAISSFVGRFRVEQAYFDLHRCQMNDLPGYNQVMAERFRQAYPHVILKDLHTACVPLREQKDAQEGVIVNGIFSGQDIIC